MDFEGCFRTTGEWDIAEIQRTLPGMNEAIWGRDQSRQATYSSHRETASIFVSNFPLDWDGGGYPQTTVLEVDDPLGAASWSLIHHLEGVLDGRVGRALYVLLPPGGVVGRHKDFGLYLSTAHRIHVPIYTNDRVLFDVDAEVLNMEVGRCIEINNMRVHQVSNLGGSPRVHFICDIIPS